MSDQKMQECFEFYYDLKWGQVNDFAQQAWKAAWQASRESLVIELPPSIGVTPVGGDGIQEFIDCNGEYLHGYAVFHAINSAGVRVK